MVDYLKEIGGYGDSYMMIRDLGQTVEFWLKANSMATHHNAVPYGWTYNGSTGSSTVPYNWPWPGGAWPTPGPWVRVRSFGINYSQNVTFRLGKTGLIAFGGPHTFTVHIQRATARINHNGTWKTAIPYVKTGGKWKIAQAMIRDGGVWKRGG